MFVFQKENEINQVTFFSCVKVIIQNEHDKVRSYLSQFAVINQDTVIKKEGERRCSKG